MKPHIKVAYRVRRDITNPPEIVVWTCETHPCSKDWVYASGFSPRVAYDNWKKERERLHREREAVRRSQFEQHHNRGRVHVHR